MDYFSKTVILHQIENGFSPLNKPLSAICRLEREDGIFKCFLTFLNVEPKQNGEFIFCLIDGREQLFTYSLGRNLSPTNFTLTIPPSVENDFSVGLYFVENNIPLLIAYSKSLNGADIVAMKKTLYDKHLKSPVKIEIEPSPENKVDASNTTLAVPLPTQEKERETEKNEEDDFIKEISKLYDDEAVATDNYYENDQELKKKLEFIERFESEFMPSQDEPSPSVETIIVDNVDGQTQDSLDTVKEEVASAREFNTIDDILENDSPLFETIDLSDIGDEKSSQEQSPEYSVNNPYFDSVKQDINNILDKFPEDKSLNNIIPNGKFVKINYAENKYYIIGIIYENKKEKYICYGVPDKYSKNPPKELNGYCQFIPLSMFNLSGDGYWMMFQDAIKGTCVKLDKRNA